jgi:hypothetical protein
MSSSRLNRICGHVAPNPTSSAFRNRNADDDVVIVAACRTAITKARKGGWNVCVYLCVYLCVSLSALMHI